jgi:hypothetical protein
MTWNLIRDSNLGPTGEQLGNNWGTTGEQLGNNWGTTGEQLKNNWGTTGEQLGNNWGTTGEQLGNNQLLETPIWDPNLATQQSRDQNYDRQNCARHLQNYDGQIVLGAPTKL